MIPYFGVKYIIGITHQLHPPEITTPLLLIKSVKRASAAISTKANTQPKY